MGFDNDDDDSEDEAFYRQQLLAYDLDKSEEFNPMAKGSRPFLLSISIGGMLFLSMVLLMSIYSSVVEEDRNCPYF